MQLRCRLYTKEIKWYKCIKTVSEIIVIQVPISFQALHLHSSPYKYKRRKHWIKNEENYKKVFTATALALGLEDTGRPLQTKKMDFQRRAAQSLQIRVLTVVAATDELFIKLL